jgi:radical SAM-linked protein
VPHVEVEDDYVDVDLGCVDDAGVLRSRDFSGVVLDALDGLAATGVDGIRFCEAGCDHSEIVATSLKELQRRQNMKRVRAHLPAITVEHFTRDWLSYRPHLLKPVVRFRLTESIDPASVVQAGNRALNFGWQGLNAVLAFDSFDALSRMLPPVQQALNGWSASTQGHSDKRPLRLEYRPAPISQWRDAPDGPDDDEVRHYSGEFRHFKEDISRSVAVGTFRIEEIMARNWLAAAEHDLWDSLAGLDLSDPNDPDLPAFDWFTWVRQESGLTAPPESTYVTISIPDQEHAPALAKSVVYEPAAALDAPPDSLFGRRRQKAALSGRLAAPSLTRMRVRWAKEMPWRLYSHLDLVRAIERAVRRAELPAAYSEGFHPRLKLSFGPPLAFGLLSDAEYFDLLLDEDFQQSAAERLSRNLPPGLRLVEARGAAAGMPALSDTINEAAYSGIIPLELEKAQKKLDDFQAMPEVSWQRIGRDNRGPVDPRKTLRAVSVEQASEGTRWELSVLLGSEGNIRPTEWAMLLFGFTAEQMAEIVIHRVALLIRRGAQIRTPFDPL